MSQDPLSAWYADFFTELPNAFWRAAVPPELAAAEVDFIIRTARRGYRVTGLDVSAEAIRHARDAAITAQLPVDLRLADMRTLPTDIRVGAAICMGNAFGYLDHTGTRKFLADLAELVTPGGTLILDYGFVAEALLPNLTMEEPPMTFGGVEAVSVNEYDTANSRWITSFTFRRGTEEHRGTSVQHVYTPLAQLSTQHWRNSGAIWQPSPFQRPSAAVSVNVAEATVHCAKTPLPDNPLHR